MPSMDLSLDPATWAQTEYGHVHLGDIRRTQRLVAVATRVAQRPSALVAQAVRDEAERQAAYDLLENSAVRPDALVHASARAAATRAASRALVLIAADGVSLTLRDYRGLRGMGSIGPRSNGARGLQVMDAVALTESGHVLGLAGLLSWCRPLHTSRPAKQRPLSERESVQWLHLRAQVRAVFDTYAPDTTRVFLHDGGADAWPILLQMGQAQPAHEFTVVRAAQDRRAGLFVQGTASDAHSYLWKVLRTAPLSERRHVSLGAGHGRTARRALLESRSAYVTLDLRLSPGGAHRHVSLYAVWMRERGRVPAGQERLEWLLLTDWPVRSQAAMRRVVGWYLERWRIEDHHKAWKKSGSDVETSRLGSVASVERWMAIHVSSDRKN